MLRLSQPGACASRLTRAVCVQCPAACKNGFQYSTVVLGSVDFASAAVCHLVAYEMVCVSAPEDAGAPVVGVAVDIQR